jgi:selenocysteine lyase/cysteine desulfurase
MPHPLDHPAARAFPPRPSGTTFLNAAYMTPKPEASLAALHRTVDRLACPNFGAEDFFDPPERIRGLLAQLIGGSPAQYSLTGAVSFGVSTLVWNLRSRAEAVVGGRRRVVGVDGQFPSNVQGWRRLEAAGFELVLVPGGAGATERLLSELDERTALVAVEPLSWTDGLRLDLEAIASAARAAGALVLVDVTQSAGVDAPLQDSVPVDVIVGAGYKWLLGPYGTGFMRLDPVLAGKLEPLESSWKNFEGARDFNRLGDYLPGAFSTAASFDHGQSSAFVRLAGWQPALQCLVDIGLNEVRAHTARFAEAVRAGLDPDRYEVSPVGAPHQATHLFRIAPRSSSDFEPGSQRLAEQGIVVSQRAGGWRISPHVYNGSADLQRLITALS